MTSSTRRFLVEITTDGRYDKRPDLIDIIGGRLWSLDGVLPNGVEVTELTGQQVEVLSKKEVIHLTIKGAEPEMVILPKSTYLTFLQLVENAKHLHETHRFRGPRSDDSQPG